MTCLDTHTGSCHTADSGKAAWSRFLYLGSRSLCFIFRVLVNLYSIVVDIRIGQFKNPGQAFPEKLRIARPGRLRPGLRPHSSMLATSIQSESQAKLRPSFPAKLTIARPGLFTPLFLYLRQYCNEFSLFSSSLFVVFFLNSVRLSHLPIDT